MKGFDKYDPQTASILNQIMDKHAEYHRQFIYRCYTDRDLLTNYRGLREAYQIEDWKSDSAMRELYRPPHKIIERFIDHEMRKKHGPKWMQDKQTFRKVCKTEPLIEPWLVVPRKKI